MLNINSLADALVPVNGVVRELDEWLSTGAANADVANLLSFWQAIDADWTNAFTRALASGKPIEIPYNGGTPYVISNTVAWDLPAGTEIHGKTGRKGGRPTIKSTAIGRIFRIATSGVSISDIIIDGNKTVINALGTPGPAIDFQGAIGCEVRNVKLLNPTREIRVFAGTTGTTIADCEISGSSLHAIQLDGATTCKNVITGSLIDSSVGFGIILTNGPYKNEISRNRCYANGIELIGVTYGCWGNRIIGNHAEGCGDNGISVTGHNNVVSANLCIGNYHNGICIYGSANAVSGNTCLNNAQQFLVDGSTWSGIQIEPAFGGAGAFNSGAGNVCDDNQATPTQGYGLRFAANSYTLWAAGASIASTQYRYYGSNVYVSTTTGTTGVTPPTHTSGAVSDGGVTWQFLYTATGVTAPGLGANNNYVSATSARGNRLGSSIDQSNEANSDIGSPDGPVKFGVSNTTPAGVIAAYGGDLFPRRRASSPFTMLYGNYSGSTPSTSNWLPFMPRLTASYTSRFGGATGLNGAGLEGCMQFITDQNRPLFASGANAVGLVDALGRLEAPVKNVSAAGTTQADATTLSLAHTRITTVTSGSGVVLPAMFAGAEMLLFNDGANAVNVYPFGTRTINSLAASAPYSVAAGSAVRVVGWDTTTYGVR